jgi:hypothetical protein
MMTFILNPPYTPPRRKLTDIAAIATFVHLRYVDLSQNHISDIQPLWTLPELLSVDVSENALATAALPAMKYLQRATFAKNKIMGAEGIAHPLLETLNLSENQLGDVAALRGSGLPSLRLLDLHGNQLTSTASVQIPSLTHLYLAGNSITSLAGLEGLVNLESLHLRGNQIESLESLDKPLPKLAYLNLRRNRITSIKEVARLGLQPALRAVVLAENPVAEEGSYRLEALVAIPHLQRLDKPKYEDEERAEAREVCLGREGERERERR